MSAPRTVLFAHSSAGGYGADRQLALLAGGLDAARYRPLVVLAQDGPLLRVLRAAGIEAIARPLAVLRRATITPAGVARLTARAGADALALGRLARRRGVALVHTNTSVTLGGAAAARIAGVPHVWHVREIYAGYERSWRLYRRLLLGADALVCVSEATRVQFGASPRARVIHDGVSPAPAGVAALRAGARERLGLAGDRFACLVAGRISDWKGQDLLVRALAHGDIPGSIALIAGDAWPGQERYVQRLERLAHELGLGSRVRMLGFREDVAALYAAADVVVVPSTRPDPLPNSALEAAAAGACVLAAAHGGLPEIVRDHVSGRLFAPGDAAALATVLGELARDPRQRARLGAAAAADVAARFAPATLTAGVQALYDELLADR